MEIVPFEAAMFPRYNLVSAEQAKKSWMDEIRAQVQAGMFGEVRRSRGPSKKHKGREPQPEKPKSKRGGNQKPIKWTKPKLEELRIMVDKDMSNEEIAAATGETYGTIGYAKYHYGIYREEEGAVEGVRGE